jgi:hypothetical protein
VHLCDASGSWRSFSMPPLQHCEFANAFAANAMIAHACYHLDAVTPSTGDHHDVGKY